MLQELTISICLARSTAAIPPVHPAARKTKCKDKAKMNLDVHSYTLRVNLNNAFDGTSTAVVRILCVNYTEHTPSRVIKLASPRHTGRLAEQKSWHMLIVPYTHALYIRTKPDQCLYVQKIVLSVQLQKACKMNHIKACYSALRTVCLVHVKEATATSRY